MNLFYVIDLVVDILIQNKIDANKKQIIGFREEQFNELSDLAKSYKNVIDGGQYELKYAGYNFIIKKLT